MQVKRFFTTSEVKNTYGYLDSQKIYELIRTIVYFCVSISLFIAGYVATKSKMNVLTVVAVLGCLPASKSLVSMIMFYRNKSCSKKVYDTVNGYASELDCLYDLIFTTEKVTYKIAHAAYNAKCLVLFSEEKIDTNGLEAHIMDYMKRASIRGVNVKVFTELSKYQERLEQMTALESEQNKLSKEVIQLLKEISL